MKIITSEEMVRMDMESRVPASVLMERAGYGMASVIAENFPGMQVVFACGRGNNGVDGLVCAKYLREWGFDIRVLLYRASESLEGIPAEKASELTCPIEDLTPEELRYILTRRSLLVDCLTGTGFSPPLRHELREIVRVINACSAYVLSCDMPTGVSGSSGESDETAVRADITVTFEYPKNGHCESSGSILSGSLEVIDIGTGAEPENTYSGKEMICRQDCSVFFRKKERKTHKKREGHLLVAGGCHGMSGAAALAITGGLRSGAGLVTGAGPASLVKSLSVSCFSALKLELPAIGGDFGEEDGEKVLWYVEDKGVTAVAAGPGMGCSARGRVFLEKLLGGLKVPLLLDADALNCLAEDQDLMRGFSPGLLITPHPGEMARLLGRTASEIQADREGAAVSISSRLGAVTVLKGYRTVVAAPGEKIYINSSGNPGMAKGGSGDVLSGIAGSLLAAGAVPLEAAISAVWVHGRAGDIAVWRSSESFFQPEDLAGNLGRI